MAIAQAFLNKKGVDTDEIPPMEYYGNIYYWNKAKANIHYNFFFKQTTLEYEDDTLPVLSQLTLSLMILHYQIPKWATLFKT